VEPAAEIKDTPGDATGAACDSAGNEQSPAVNKISTASATDRLTAIPADMVVLSASPGEFRLKTLHYVEQPIQFVSKL
jgi:hypothetical protein